MKIKRTLIGGSREVMPTFNISESTLPKWSIFSWKERDGSATYRVSTPDGINDAVKKAIKGVPFGLGYEKVPASTSIKELASPNGITLRSKTLPPIKIRYDSRGFLEIDGMWKANENWFLVVSAVSDIGTKMDEMISLKAAKR